MSTRINIETGDLIAAGWECKVVGNINHKHLVIKKGCYEFTSDVDYCFCAVCNSSNLSEFSGAGLFKLPYI